MNTKDFSLKFIDIMIGIVLGLGFQWWTALTAPWQYMAFVFVYVDIIDYWIDYGPSLRKYPPKKEFDLILDVIIMFNLFLYIFSTQKETSLYFLVSFVLLRILDMIWIGRAIKEYPEEGLQIKKWLKFNAIEAAVGGLAIILTLINPGMHLFLTVAVILLWVCMRIYISVKYKRMHLI
jgi:hypothetical protein